MNADYWHHVRETVFEQFSPETAVLGLCGTGGDPWHKRNHFGRQQNARAAARTSDPTGRVGCPEQFACDRWTAGEGNATSLLMGRVPIAITTPPCRQNSATFSHALSGSLG